MATMEARINTVAVRANVERSGMRIFSRAGIEAGFPATQAVSAASHPAERTGSGRREVLSSADVFQHQNLNPAGAAVPAEGAVKSSSDSHAPGRCPRLFGANRHHRRLRRAGGLRAGITGWGWKERRLAGGYLPQFPCQRAAPDRHQGECWGEEPGQPDPAPTRRQTPRGKIVDVYPRTALRHGSCLPQRRHHGG